MKLQHTALAGAVAIGLAIGIYVSREPPRHEAHVLNPPTMVPSAINAFGPREQAAASASVAAAPATPAQNRPPSKAAAIEALSKGTIAQRFSAYMIVSACLGPDAIYKFNTDTQFTNTPLISYPPPDRAANCGDIMPGQIAARREWLVDAVRAGVKGAYVALLQQEGPAGQFSWLGYAPMPETEYVALVEVGYKAGLTNADPSALRAEVDVLEASDKKADRLEALRRHSAYLITQWQDTRDPPDVLTNQRTKRLLATVPADEGAEAIAAGRALAKRVIR
jgi:hypothetical protein